MKKFLIIAFMAVCLVAFGGATVWAVDGGSGGDAHNLAGTQGTCSKCHIPHGGTGDKIWAQALDVATDFTGVHLLCNSCHYDGDTFNANSGEGNVFNLNAYMNHVMLGWADTVGGEATIPGGGLFPLDTGDTDTVPSAGSNHEGAQANEGFYCGSCHNPHQQPFDNTTGNGDYLRVDTATSANINEFGLSGARIGACLQCHSGKYVDGNSAGHDTDCFVCHHPHEGINMPADGNALANELAEKILIATTGTTFTAPPNVPGFTAATKQLVIANMCYDCHDNDGDAYDATVQTISNTLEHHPMGTNADATDHAAGYDPGTNGELGCTAPSGCHDMHDGTYDFYLDPTIGTYAGVDSDDGGFCLDLCHDDGEKTEANLGTSTEDHNQTKASSGNSRGSCFMCHYIHDGTTNATAVNPGDDPSEDSLMRENATNLLWAKTAEDTDADALDYEDLCATCHFSAVLSKGVGAAGSTFAGTAADPTFFSHIFTGVADTDDSGGNATSANMSTAGLPTGDGEYGTISGELWCGSCHDPHVQNTSDQDGNFFLNINNDASERSGLCVDCHGDEPMVGGGTTHPVGTDAVLPTAPITASPVPGEYASGGDGVTGGMTSTGAVAGNMQCETCHNFHNSATNRIGGTADHTTAGQAGKLVITDNADDSSLCYNCHNNY